MFEMDRDANRYTLNATETAIMGCAGFESVSRELLTVVCGVCRARWIGRWPNSGSMLRSEVRGVALRVEIK